MAEMNVSHVHSVELAEEKLPDNLMRTLVSCTPQPLPTIVTDDAAVFATIDDPFPTSNCAEENRKDALNATTALFSTVKAKFRKLPSDGGCVHVTAVSLFHRVALQMLLPMRKRGFESAFEKYLPISRTFMLPVVL